MGADGALFKSPATAPVTLVECSDLHGPCGTRVVPPLAQLASQYGDHVNSCCGTPCLTSLIRERARRTSEQGRGWASHDALCAHAPKTAPEQLKASAPEVRLDLPG